MADPKQQHGAFSWLELMTTDVAAAQQFYGSLFGWTIKRSDMVPGMVYDEVQVAGQSVAGMVAIPPQSQGMPPCWGVYVTVSDIDATAEQAVALGGKVVMGPQDIPQVGRFAVIVDPQGASLSVIEYLTR